MAHFSILVLDDDVALLRALSEKLQPLDFVVDLAESGQKGHELLGSKVYDLILMDLHLPGIDPIKLFHEIKNAHPNTIIFLMTEGKFTDLNMLASSGISTFIQKPLNMKSITEMILHLGKQSVILVVDDDENDRNLLVEILKNKGYQIHAAKTGTEALDFILHNSFDVVLLDLRLPDIDGITVLEKIKEHKPGASIIAVTGYSLDGIIEKVVSRGAYTCLLKPFNVDMLLKEISYVLRKRDEKVLAMEIQKVVPSLLLVEDNENLRETMKDILEAEGMHVDTAGSVSEATASLEKTGYDMVVSDLSLGQESGLALVDPVRKKDRFTSFILITGFGTMETALEAIKKDVDEYILKPVKPAELVHKVKTHLENRKLNQEKERLVVKLQESNIRLMELSKTDELTGAQNRRCLFEELHSEMQRARRQSSTLALMMIDVDGFKQYNDAYGHIEGDKVLKEIVVAIRTMVRQHVDTVYRYGGDEFAVVVPDVTEVVSLNIARRVVEKVKNTLGSKGIGISVGVTYFGGTNMEMSLNELIDSADKKMYMAKKSGGGKVIGA